MGDHKSWKSQMLKFKNIGLGHNEMIGCCECGSELLGFIEGMESFEYLTDC